MFLQCEFPSAALGYPARVELILPDRKTDRPFPLLYLLHGGDGAPWVRHTSVERCAEKAGLAVVMPHAGNTCWRNADISFPGMAIEAPKKERYEDFLLTELPGILKAYFPVSDAPEDTYIAGLSLGGYGAAFYGTHYPERFRAVGLFSAYLFSQKMFSADRGRMTEEELKGELIPELTDKLAELSSCPRIPRFVVVNGTKDIQEFSPLYAKLLREQGAEVVTDLDGCEAGHEWAAWEYAIRLFIEDIRKNRKPE